MRRDAVRFILSRTGRPPAVFAEDRTFFGDSSEDRYRHEPLRVSLGRNESYFRDSAGNAGDPGRGNDEPLRDVGRVGQNFRPVATSALQGGRRQGAGFGDLPT